MNRVVKLLVAGIAGAGSLVAGIASASGAEAPLRLENARIAVAIDPQNGAIQSIRDKQQDVLYPQTGMGFQVVTKAGTLRSENATAVKTKAGEAELSFTGNGLDVTLHYRLGAGDHFIEKWLEIKASDGQPYFLKSVVLEDMATKAFSEIHFHDDNTIWHCPINLFLRAENGGCFAGIAYPYWELEQRDAEGFRLGYAPNYQAAANEVNVSEKYFIGVYRKEGIHRVSQGPYPGRGRCKLLGWGGKCGLSQHFKGGIPNPVRDVPLEELDWGEVWSMQEFMRHVLPDDLPLPEDGFWIWQNGWWAGLWKIEPGILDRLKQAGIHDVMTAHTWYGRGNHPLSPPYIDQMRTEPMGFPKDTGIAGLPGPAGPAAGLHANHAEAKLDSFAPGKYTPEFVMPPAMKALYDHGRKIGVHVSSFSLPGICFKDHPEWASIDEDGKVSEYLFGRKVSCPACDPYMDFMVKLLDHVMTQYKPRWWGFDGRWLSYWEVPHYRPGPKGLGFDLCHATNHGHLPGDNLYKEWKNIQKLVREIRRRHPKMCLEQYLGLKRGGPWAMRYFNCDDNYYETNGALMNRFQAWHNQNDRFRPVYKNYAAIFGGSPAAFRTSVISSISATSYCQIGPGYADLALEENREFLKKWRAWATGNHDYLKVKRDLFDAPGESPLDGSAHIIKDRGFLFLFSVGGQAVRASIPLNRWIQLDEKPDALYQIKEVYPREGTALGVYQYGEEFLYDMPTDSAVILALEPAPNGSAPRRPEPGAQISSPAVIPAFSATPSRPQESGAGNFFLRAGDRIMLLGNSITAQAAPEVEFIQQDLKQHHPGLGAGDGAVSFSNVGTHGWQAWQGLEKLKEYLAKHKPTVCVIGYGTCEVTFQNQKSYVPAMKAIVKQLREAGVAMTIVAPPPPSPGNWKQSFPLAHFVQGLPEMGKLARQVAEEEGVPFVDTQAAFAPLVKAGQEFTTDGIHLNSAGYRVMAEALLECWSREKR